MSFELRDRYIATFLLHALGDTIGFKNGNWEFTKPTSDSILEKLYEFIELGGINNINLKNWNVSDDTILHMAIARSLILQYDNFDDLENNTVKNIIHSIETMLIDAKNEKNRYIGNTTFNYFKKLKQNENWKNFEFDPNGGGNGSAMRCNCIGLAFFGEENRQKLIKYAINSSKMTHVNPIGWLGGLSTALFTAFAIENIQIYKWIKLLIHILESNDVKKYVDFNNTDEMNSYEEFIQSWKTYYDSRFDHDQPIKIKSHSNLVQRSLYYSNIFSSNKKSQRGFSGYSAVIIAYDCLLDADQCWEKLVIYAMINNFDADTIGAIAGGLYGTMYGFKNIPEQNLQQIEFKDKLIKIGKLMYKKYFLQLKL